MIDRFFQEMRWLSNFWKADVVFEGKVYSSTEHAYQAAKTFNEEERKTIRETDKCGAAKRLGMKVTLRPDWDEIKYDVMLELVRQKFFNHTDLGEKLLATGDEELVESNKWHDNFWGDCGCANCVTITGHNNLGKILMLVRDKLRQSKQS